MYIELHDIELKKMRYLKSYCIIDIYLDQKGGGVAKHEQKGLYKHVMNSIILYSKIVISIQNFLPCTLNGSLLVRNSIPGTSRSQTGKPLEGYHVIR